MKCWKCENELAAGSVRCDACGARVSDDPELSTSAPDRTEHSAAEGIGPGTVIAKKFRVLEELGRGGMAIVYRALDFTLHREVALKTLPPRGGYDPSYQERFLSEAQRMAKLRDHPNIVTVYEAGRSGDTYFIAMSLVDGPPLMDWRRKQGAAIDEKDILRVMIKIALAVHHAHVNEIIHRDIKPSNILMTAEGEPILTDFGLARGVNVDDSKITVTSMMLGTPAYMSPEQAGGKEVTYLTDIYSLGVVFFEMLTGVLPFTGSVNSIIHSHAYKSPPQIGIMNPDVPDSVSDIVHRMLEKDPGKRFHSGKQAAHEMEKVLEALERDPGDKAGATTWKAGADYKSAVDLLLPKKGRSAGKLPLMAAAALVIVTLIFFGFSIAYKLQKTARSVSGINRALAASDISVAVELLGKAGLGGSAREAALSSAIAETLDLACMESEDPDETGKMFESAVILRERYGVANQFGKCMQSVMRAGILAYEDGDLESARLHMELLDFEGTMAGNCDFNWMMGLTYFGLGEKEKASPRLRAVGETWADGDWTLCDPAQAEKMLKDMEK